MKPAPLALGILFLVGLFFAGPAASIALNDALGWPRFAPPLARPLGWGLVGIGIGILSYASHLFRTVGRGTPVPIDPPRALVDSGPYRYSRNPIYVADLCILIGIFLIRGHLALLLYALLVLAAIHLWLIRREEPVLADRFGDAWLAYRARVPRWIGRPRAD